MNFSFLTRTMTAHRSQAEDKKPIFEVPTIREYFMDLEFVLSLISDGPAKSFAYRRLQYLSGKFTMHSLLNEFQEMTDMKVSLYLLPLCDIPAHSPSFSLRKCLTGMQCFHPLSPELTGDHRDFYNVRKVDTHVHHSSSMNQKHLLRFIKHKMKHSPQVCFHISSYGQHI